LICGDLGQHLVGRADVVDPEVQLRERGDDESGAAVVLGGVSRPPPGSAPESSTPLAEMKNWKILRDYRAAHTLAVTASGIAFLRNLTITG